MHTVFCLPKFEIRLQTAKNQQQVLQKAVGYTFARPVAFHPWFKLALSLEIESLQDGKLTSFFASLALLSQREIDGLISGTPDGNTDFFGHLGKSALIQAFGTSISHLECFATLDNEILQSSRASDEDRFVFRARIRQLTRWRLNFRNPNVNRYYPMLADRFFDARLKGLDLSLSRYKGALENLVNEWGLTHESSMTA